jgi:hypothetical protein
MDHPGILTKENPDGTWGIKLVSHTPNHPSENIKTFVNHPGLDGHVHLGDTHIDPKDIKPATKDRIGGHATDCEVEHLCEHHEKVFNDPNRPTPVRTQSLPPPKLEHHDQEEHNPKGQESDASKTHHKSASSEK